MLYKNFGHAIPCNLLRQVHFVHSSHTIARAARMRSRTVAAGAQDYVYASFMSPVMLRSCPGKVWLTVNFREVVHSVRTGNADVAKPQRFAEDRMDTHKN